MGLLDSIIGSVTGSHGSSGSSGGTSPLVKALLMLLAAKAATHYLGQKDQTATAPGGAPSVPPSGKIESGILAGMPSLDGILEKFKSAGHHDKVESWIGTGPNKPIAPKDVSDVLGHDTVDQLQRKSGLPKDQLLSQLSSVLPSIVDKLTPNGHLPSEADRKHW